MHPFFIPHMLNMRPYDVSLLANTSRFKSTCSYYGDIWAQPGNGCLIPGGIGDASFNSDGQIITSRSSHSDKYKSLIKGAGLDVFYDYPLFHRAIITKINDNGMVFEMMDDPVSFTKCPVHTDESHKARMHRQAMEVLFHRKIHWMTRKALNRLSDQAILDLDLNGLLVSGYGVKIHQDQFPGAEAMKQIVVGQLNLSPVIDFPNARIGNNGVSVQGRHPDSVAAALIGKEATAVIDHWMVEGIEVKSIKNTATTMRVTFKAPGITKSYAEDEPERALRILNILRNKERSLTPSSVLEWEEKIAILDQDRNPDPEWRFDTIHHYRKANGPERRHESPRLPLI